MHSVRNQDTGIVYESGKKSLAAPRPSARPLWSEGTATHPFFASRRPNRPAGLLFGSFLLPNSDDAARLCQDRARGWRALQSIRCRRSHRKGQPRRSISCAGPQGGTLPPTVVTLFGGRRSPVTGECPPPAESEELRLSRACRGGGGVRQITGLARRRTAAGDRKVRI